MSKERDSNRPDAPTAALIERLRHVVVAATLTPMAADGTVSVAAVPDYVDQLVRAGVGGLAVWAHTGRGPYLDPGQQDATLRAFRSQTQLPVIAGVGTRQAGAADPDTVRSSYRDIARRAAAGGADGLLVLPPPALRDHPDREDLLVELHQELAEDTGLPLVLFVLHAEAGGFPFSLGLLRRLLALPQAVGVKLATLDSAMTCQEITWLVREEFPDRLAITGEDRMFGPSLMWGADSALVGIASALPELSVELMDSWFRGDRSEFFACSDRLDQLARWTFCAPMEGYVQRMHWVAAATGALPADAAHDPYGPTLPAAERDRILDFVRASRAIAAPV